MLYGRCKCSQHHRIATKESRHNTTSPIISTISIQATSANIRDPLHAEAQAMIIASQVAKALEFENTNFISDSQILVNTIVQDNFLQQLGDWRLRPLLYQFKSNTEHCPHKVLKISRNYNRPVHNLAQRAFSALSNDRPQFSCNHIDHGIQCLTIQAKLGTVVPNLCNLFLN